MAAITKKVKNHAIPPHLISAGNNPKRLILNELNHTAANWFMDNHKKQTFFPEKLNINKLLYGKTLLKFDSR
jgi:hypothetical protein